jgi:hypothetical protein
LLPPTITRFQEREKKLHVYMASVVYKGTYCDVEKSDSQSGARLLYSKMQKLIGDFVVFTEKKPAMMDVLRDIDVVEKPPTSLTPEARKILDAIYNIQKSGKSPALGIIEMKLLQDATEEISKQPLVQPASKVTTFESRIIRVEEIVEATGVRVRSSLVKDELKDQLAELIKAGYLAMQFEGKEEIQWIYKLTPEGIDQIEKFNKQPGLV